MAAVDPYAVLNDAFVRVYRSLTQYLIAATPTYDVGGDVVPAIIDRQTQDLDRLGRAIYQQRGFIDTGSFPTDFSDLHFANMSAILDRWIDHQKELVSDLRALRGQIGDRPIPELEILDEIIAHEAENLQTMSGLLQAT